MSSKSSAVTCSFTLDRDLYNAYKSIVVRSGENVKGNLIEYMKSVVNYDTPNAETIAAIREAEQLKNDPNRKAYGSFAEILAEIDDE